MPWPATSRYGMVPVPGGLGLAQDLLNTAPAGHQADLLGQLATARKWVSEATAQWAAATGRPAPEVVLDADGLRQLRAFRDDLREVFTTAEDAAPETGPAPPVRHTGAAELELGADGSVRLRPRETGHGALVVLVLAALFESQQASTFHRLKICRNPRCRVAFYDRSRNVSGVWHSVRICGNAINLRAHRERQRGRA